MRMVSVLMAGLLAAGFARADKPAADGAANATDVVKAAIKAHGGEEALNKYKAGSMSMKGEMSMQGLELEFDGKVTYCLPDKFKMKINTAVMGQKIAIDQVMNGKKFKMSLNGMDMPVDDHAREQLQGNITDQEITQLTPLLDAAKYTIKSGDDADVNGSKADVIIVNSEKSKVKDMKLFFDKKTHLLVKSQKKNTDETGKEIDEESFFEDYKEVQKLMTPHKGHVKHDGKEFMKFTISDIKLMEKIDDKEFPVDD